MSNLFEHLFSDNWRKLLLSVICIFTLSVSVFAQTKTVKGVVRNDKNEPVAGATVTVKGTKTATSTAPDGTYTIQVPSGSNILQFSSIGFATLEITIDGKNSIEVQMQASATQLGDVVVVAYGGSQKKATVSGSIATVKGEEILKSPTINVSNSLAGRVPGLTVVAQGGEPGNDFSSILIRGVNTFGNATPLFVIDGIPLQGSDKLQRIDPSVIESITVLKDASAAIYGSQGANGVIIITTKRGKAGKLSVSASFNYGIASPTKLPKMLNSFDLATLHNEALLDSSIPAPSLHPAKYSVYELAGYLKNEDPWLYPNTDWVNEVLKKSAGQSYANVTVSVGSEKVRGSVSIGSRYQDGFYRNGSNKYNQYDIRSNMDMNVSKDILFSVDLNGRFDKGQFATADAGRIFSQTIYASPTRHAYWPNGIVGQPTDPTGQSGSPVAISTPLSGYNNTDNYVLNALAKLNIKIPWVPGLAVTGNATIDRSFANGKAWTIPVNYNEWDGASTTSPVFTINKQGDLLRTLSERQSRNKNYLVNFLVNYDKKFGIHSFKVLAGYEEYERAFNSLATTRKGFDADNLDELVYGSSNGEQIIQNNPGATRWRNYIGRVNYDFNSKIFVEFVARYQGSSIFSSDNRWGFFPGGSVAYRISEEKFWKNSLPFINSFKLRASYGQTGNDLVPQFQYLSLYNTFYANYVEQAGPNGPLINNVVLYSGVAPNKSATWEKANQLDIGFDAEIINNKLSITFDYFRNKRTDILAKKSGGIPSSTGIVPADENIGEFLNRGFDFNIQYKKSAGQFKYQVGFNGLYAKNKILFWDEVVGRPDYQKTTGHPLGSGSYYHVLGVFHDASDLAKYTAQVNGVTPTLGDLIFEDVNGDGKVDNLDLKKSDKSNTPVFSAGITTNFQYKNFDLSILFQGAVGAERYMRPTFGLDGNYLQSFFDKRWTLDNPNTNFPKVFSGQSAYWSDPNGVFNTFFVRKTDYVRLKTVELGYNLPKPLVSKAGIQGIRVYVSTYNLLTYAPDLKDFYTDPEESIRDQFYGESYPLQRIVNFGINVNF
jgi:TonB-dependent starch-binding outer membrane protein SusC